jgi:hypothetical protein
MRKVFGLLALLVTCNCFSQTLRLAGKVYSQEQKPIAGASVFIPAIQIGTTTDSLGNYLLLLPKGTYFLQYSHVSYFIKREKVNLKESIFLDVTLEENVQELNEIEITGQARDHNVTSLDVGVNKLEMKEFKRMPAFLGEVDVVKSILFLPGVTSVGEGTSNVNVRGSNSDQNLILMEGTPIFNPSHLMGLLSVFNPDVTKNITLYRGSIPAYFGGRASSVMDIESRGSNATKLNVQGGVGFIANRALLEGPLIKDKVQFLVASRFSFPDYLLSMVGNKSLQNTNANFYDVTARADYRMNPNNKIILFGYFSSDNFKPASDSIASTSLGGSPAFRWQTQNLKLEWIHSFSEKTSLNVAGVYSGYSSTISSEQPDINSFDLKSRLEYISLKPTWSYQSQKHRVHAGGEGIHYSVNPGNLTPGSATSSVNALYLNNERSFELSAFASDEIQINKWFSVMAGLRYSTFMNTGPGNVYVYDPSVTKSVDSITDTIRYQSNQVIKTYGGFEPRAAFNFKLSERISVKIGYSKLRQYIQRITNTTSALPTDRWQLSNTYIKPTVSDQLSVGYFQNFSDNAWEASVEVYSKTISNATDYKDGQNLLLNQATETALLQGEGRAKGIELQVKKNKGQLTGWLNYTYSQTELLINGSLPDEKINSGKWYPANYNKPHILNFTLTYSISPRTSFSTNFTYSTGRPTTYATGQYMVGTIVVPNYTNRNQDQIPDYHRLDVSLTVEPNMSKKTKIRGTWIFSIYNLYGRKNAYSIFTQTNNAALVDTYKLSIFGSIFPSITYNFKIN